MKQEDLIKITAVADEEVIKCEILSKKENEITFVVDENLKRINYHCSTSTSEYIVREILSNRVAADQVHLVTSSFKDDRLCFSSKDVLFETIAKCFASHRPLVLSPDMIWLIISQSISNQINSNPEKYRDRVVSHDGKLNIKVRLPDCSDLINRPDEIDFADVFEMFYSKIDKLTKNDITPKLAADFTTTGPTERIASVITVMDAFKTYFNYILISCICGIPYIVLKGTAEDWAKLRAKTEILLDFDLEDWHKWLQPILFEFERASKGCPNKLFWRSIVSSISQKEVDLGRGCIPFGTKVDGWFLALFPFNSSGKRCAFEKGSLSEHKACEIMSVDFIYEKEVLTNNGIEVETHPMEMWAGFVGYKEEEETGALEPQIGWFIRQKDEKKEQLSALESMLNCYRKLEIEDEFPEVLKDLEERDTITFCLKKEIDIPDWVFKLKAEKLVFRGNFKFWKKMLNTLRYPNVKFLDLEEEDDGYVEEPEEMSEQEEPEEEATGFNNTTQKLDNEVQFTYQGVDKRICKGCIYVRGIVGNGEGCGRLGTENFRTRYLSGECEFKKTDLFKPSAFERKRMEEQRLARANAEKQCNTFALNMVKSFINERLNGDIKGLKYFNFDTLKRDTTYGNGSGNGLSLVYGIDSMLMKSILALVFADAWPDFTYESMGKHKYEADTINITNTIFGIGVNYRFSTMDIYELPSELVQRIENYARKVSTIGNTMVLPFGLHLNRVLSTFGRGYTDFFLQEFYKMMIGANKSNVLMLEALKIKKKEVAISRTEQQFNKIVKELMLEDFLDESGKPKQVFQGVMSWGKGYERETYRQAIIEYLDFCEPFIDKRADRIIEKLEQILANNKEM